MKKADILIIGGSAAGVTAAITAHRHYPEKNITLVRKEEKVPVPCGIPYVFGTIEDPNSNLIPDAVLTKNSVELVKSEVSKINPEQKTIVTGEGEIAYERLIIATGSLPAEPPIPGIKTNGVYSVLKDMDHLAKLKVCCAEAKNIVVIGGGFIGVEFADEINKMGNKNITIVEIMDHCLSLAYDAEFCTSVESILKERGLNLLTSTKVKEIVGESNVEKVVFSDGASIDADLVIMCIGAKTNVALAKDANLEIGSTGAIMVDRTMKTSNEHIFACGDCAEKISFFGGKPSYLKLASIATTEARIAGANLFGISRENVGTVGVWGTAVGNTGIATAGLTEEMALKQGYEVAIGSVECPNRHPGCMPGATKMKIKLVFEKRVGTLLGGQIMGDLSAGEAINTLSACILSRMTAENLATFQLGTHPAMTASPIAYQLINAAELALMQMGHPRG